jgi:hypothetical protein
MTNDIEIWASYGSLPITGDILSEPLLIRIEKAPALPQDIEDCVAAAWKRATEQKPLQDNDTTYLQSMDLAGEQKRVDVTVRGFRYTQAFNRTAEFQDDVEELNEHKLLTLSTHVHLLTKDGKLLFGRKRNQYGQISGFSGFPQVASDSVQLGSESYLDLRKTITNRLKPEIGMLTDAISGISALGVTYVNAPLLRGTDADYLVHLDETAANAQKLFSASKQFDKELFVVDFEPLKIREFINDVYANGQKFSHYALGCEYLVAKAAFGEDEAASYVKNLDEQGINLRMRSDPEYFG